MPLSEQIITVIEKSKSKEEGDRYGKVLSRDGDKFKDPISRRYGTLKVVVSLQHGLLFKIVDCFINSQSVLGFRKGVVRLRLGLKAAFGNSVQGLKLLV